MSPLQLGHAGKAVLASGKRAGDFDHGSEETGAGTAASFPESKALEAGCQVESNNGFGCLVNTAAGACQQKDLPVCCTADGQGVPL